MAAPYVSEHVVEDDEEDEFFSSNPSSEDESDAIDSSSEAKLTKELASNTIKLPEKSDDEDETSAVGNKGWAKAMAKVLRTNETKISTSRSVILAKGKTDEQTAETKRKKQRKTPKRKGFEIVPKDEDGTKLEEEEEENETKDEETEKSRKEIIKEIQEKRLKKRNWKEMGRVKPDITAREKERFFQRVATAGVVQLFNAVKQRQSNMESELKKVGSSEVKRERVIKSMTKGDFLDALKNIKSVEVPKQNSQRRVKDVGSKDKPAWNVLSEDYMMGAKMKDWDKESESDDNDETKKVSDNSDDSE